MLKWYIFNWKFTRFVVSGFNIDYCIKKYFFVIIKWYIVYSGLFFGEKYVIEIITKKSVDSFLYNFNKVFGYNFLLYTTYFIQILAYLICLISIYSIFIII